MRQDLGVALYIHPNPVPAGEWDGCAGIPRGGFRHVGVFSHQALTDAVNTIGIDNVMFSIDYPFEPTGQAAEFIPHRTARPGR